MGPFNTGFFPSGSTGLPQHFKGSWIESYDPTNNMLQHTYSRSWEEHLHHLEAVLQALRAAALTANPNKCSLAEEEANYLGYTVGRGNVKPQSKKIDSILTWPQPQTKKQVRTFLGLVGYYLERC